MKKRTSTPSLTPRVAPTIRAKLSITIQPDVLASIDERADNRSEQINSDLTRYYRLVAEARASLRTLLSPAELSAIIDVQNGHWYAPRLSHQEITANIDDACRLDGLAEKWRIDGATLVAKLMPLDLWQITALCDATERLWHGVGEGDHTRDPARALD